MTLEVGPPRVPATKRSGTITTGATAQDLMPHNATRQGWSLQNQSAGDLFVCSKGSAETTAATADQNSLKTPAGQYYVADHVSAHALSIYGATTGQAFFAEEW
jgi:hypothetical protein